MKPENHSSLASLRLDTVNQRLWRGTEVVPLTPKAFIVLRYLTERPGQLVTKEELLNAAWPNVYVSDAALKVCIGRLRQTLGDHSHPPQLIETVHWRGYRFIGKISSQETGDRKQEAEESEVRSPKSKGWNQKTGDRRQKTEESEVRSPKSEVQGLEKSKGKSLKSSVRSQKETGDWRLETSPPSSQASSLKPQAPELVGRESELTQLHQWLEKALSGKRQIVFVTGEPGIGKTALVEAFVADAVSRFTFHVSRSTPQTSGPQSPVPGLWLAHGQCIEHYGAGEAYLPVLEALERLCRTPGHETLIPLLNRHAPLWLTQMPSLIGPAERKRLRRETEGASSQRMLRTLAEALEALTAATPLVLVLEDLHWGDYATLDLLSFLARRQEPARLLLISTYRPGEMTTGTHPLKSIKHELQAHGHCQELSLSFLSEAAVHHYLTLRFPASAFSPAFVRELYQYTEGNPFFLVNIVDDLVAHGVIIHTDGQWFPQENWEKGQLRTPGSVQQLIEAQTDRLSQEEQRVLEVASVVGVEFSAAAVAAGLGMEVLGLEERCEGLARRAQFLLSQGSSEWPDGTVSARYRFLHSLYQQACYNRVTAGKRVQLHRQIGERIATAYGERAKEIAAELVVHFERGHDSQRAVYYCQKAAENALRRYGYREAIDHLTKGLQLLQKLPDSPERVRQEIDLQIPLGVALVATKGHAAPEVEHVYARALALCQQAEVMPQLGWALWGLQTCYFVRGKLQTARECADQLLSVAQRYHHKELLGVAHYLLGSTLFSLGELSDARAHLEQGIAVCTSEKHQRLQVACCSFVARTLWALGYPEQALAMNQEALTLAHELAHPFTLVVALGITALLHVARREAPIVQAQAEAAMKLAADHGFTDWMAQATLLRGWALAEQGREAMGIEQMRQGLAAYQATGATVGQSLFLGLLADVYGKAGRITEGLQAVTEARSVTRQNGQRVWEAWLEWLTGELTLRKFQVSSFKFQVTDPRPLAPDPQAEAEGYFLKAIEIARRQQAKSLELRATISLVRLQQQQVTQYASRNTHHETRTRLDAARNMLSEIYGWFTEGFHTPDLREAKLLLEELNRAIGD